MANTIGWGQAAVNNTIDWGKGKTNNTIGWGTIYSSSPYGDTDLVGTPAGDADALAFISAAAITDDTQKSAIDKLVVDLKGYGIWSKMKAIYPFVGGTAAQHKFNLKNPLDTDAAFRLVFSGGWVHSSTGAKPNGTNAYADTKLIPFNNLTNNNYHLSNYSRTQIITTPDAAFDMGCSQANGVIIALSQYLNASTKKVLYAGNVGYGFISADNTNTLGFQIGTRPSQTSAKMFMNNVSQGTVTNENPFLLPVTNFLIATQFSGGLGAPYGFSSREKAFASIGDGLTDTEAANYYTAVQTFQTTLSRNV